MAKNAKGSMARIAAEAMQPITKDSGHADAKRVATAADIHEAAALAAEVIAACKGEEQGWRPRALRALHMTNEGRAEFIRRVNDWLSGLRKAHADSMGMAPKVAKARVASGTTKASELRTIAAAFNGGATVAGLIEYDWTSGGAPKDSGGKPQRRALDDISFPVILEYARTFSDAKAGRKPDSMLVRVGKFLERNPVTADASDEDKAVHAAMVETYNRCVAAQRK